ncbi:hypothetical protein LPJ59_004654, partial [Coemansia sp. RSA 2399]
PNSPSTSLHLSGLWCTLAVQASTKSLSPQTCTNSTRRQSRSSRQTPQRLQRCSSRISRTGLSGGCFAKRLCLRCAWTRRLVLQTRPS